MDSFTLKKIEFDAIRHVLASYCGTSTGKKLAIGITPSKNPDVITHWLEQTSQMLAVICRIGPPPMAGVTDIRKSLSLTSPSGGANAEDFATIAITLIAASNVKSHLGKCDESLDKIVELTKNIGSFEGEIKAVAAVIAQDGSILDNASKKLSEIRALSAKTTKKIHDVIYGYLRLEEVARLLQNPTVTLHGDRYVLPVKAENRGRLPGVVHRSSNTGATVFVEPNACVELNNQLFDLAEEDRREVGRLLNMLSSRVFARSKEITATCDTLAKIDIISAKAQYSQQFSMSCPAMCERGHLQLNEVRHPLLIAHAHQQKLDGTAAEKIHAVVPIDIRLGSDFDLLIITGSNTGGKTVTLKTLALMAVMAQAGMHIPARRGGVMPIFRDIFIDIGDEQSLEQSLSTFGAHVKRVNYILRKADKFSLILLDELGSGTDPDEGGAIGQAILDELRSIGCMGMITTHLSILKAYAFSHQRVDNASVEFDTATLSPTYRLRIGTPGESHAITVAAHLGMPRRITTAAKKHFGSRGKRFRKAIKATTAARETAEAARAEAQNAQLAAADQAQTYEAKLADLHSLQQEFETWLARLPELQRGDEVPVPAMNKTGRLIRMELHRQLALVDCDGVEVEVPISDLMPSLGQDQVRNQITKLREQILLDARQSKETQTEALRLHNEYQRSLKMQKQRARQFDNWLGDISRMKIGNEVTIAQKPGKGTLISTDLAGLGATVKTHRGDLLKVSLQDLFPQTGPFAKHSPSTRHDNKKLSRRNTSGKNTAHPSKVKPDRPITRRQENSKKTKSNRQAILKIKPGDQVFVVPFNKRATLIRLDRDKSLAVVQSGIFELELPLADIEPVVTK